MLESEKYPANLLDLFEAQRLNIVDELERKRLERERHVDFQSAELIALGGLENYCILLENSDSKVS